MSRCPNCMSELQQDQCTRCGYPSIEVAVIRGALPRETVLVEQYELGYALAANQQGIAYIAFDRAANQPVIVQEFFPKQAVVRKGAAVSPKNHQAMYADACRRFLTSAQQMPLQLVNAFAANNTAYRVYQLNGSPVSAVDEAEMLLDQFIWFRGQDGKPLMAVNALPIPPLPQQTPWQLSSRLVSEQKRKNINRMAAMLLVVIAAAVAGVVYLNVTRLYDVSVRVQTEAPITGAQLGDLILPPAVPSDGYVEYTAQLRSGEYAFTAKNEKEMDVSSVVQVQGAATAARLAIPTTTPEPMRIRGGEWLFVSNGRKTLYRDGAALNVTEERLADGTELCSFTLFAAEGDKPEDDAPLLYLVREEDQSRAALVWQNNRVEFQASPGAYSLVCEMDGEKRILQDIDLTAGQCTLPVPVRAYGCLFDLEKTEGAPRSWFAGEYDCGAVAAEPEELADWAKDDPNLFGKFQMYEVSFQLDKRLENLGAQLFINGNETAWRSDKDIAWFNGVERMVDAEVRLNGVTCHKETVNVRATESTAYILGESLVQDAEKAWQDVCSLMRIGDIAYISWDGENFEPLQTAAWNDMQDRLKLLTHEEQGQFAMHEVKINMPEPVRVPADAVTGVELGGQSIAWNEAGQQEPLSISNGTYDLLFVMKDGGKLPEQIRVEGTAVTIEMESVKADALAAYERVNQCTGIAGLMEDAQGNVFFLMQDGYSVPEVSVADVLRDEQRYGSAKWHELKFSAMHDVSILLDERIDPEKAKVSDAALSGTAIEVEGRSFGVSKVTPGEYALTFSVNGVKRSIALRVADNNNLNLLSKEADEQLATLVFGKDDENAEPVLLAGDTSLLTDAAVAAAEPGELHPLTLILPEAEERIDCSIAVLPDAEGAKPLSVQPESPTVYLTAGKYTLTFENKDETAVPLQPETVTVTADQRAELDLTEKLALVKAPVFVPQEIRMAIDERVNAEEAILAVKLNNQKCWEMHAENPWECVSEVEPGTYKMLVQLCKGEQHEYTLTVTGALAEDGETQKLTHVLTNAEGAEVKALLADVADEACAAMRWWGTPEKGYVQLAGKDWNWLLTEDALEATKDAAHEVTVVFPLQRWRNDDMTFELHLTEQPTQVLHFRKNVHMTEDNKEVRKKIQILYLPDGNYEMWTTYGNGVKKETRKLGTITVTAANEQPLVLGPGQNEEQMLVRGETEWEIKLIQEFYDKAGIEKEQHICNFTIYVRTDSPSCTEKGNEVYRCSDPNCNKESKTEIDAPGHSYTAVVTAPTCTEEGYTTYTCACGDSYTGDKTAATGHTYTSAVTAPTCTEEGYTTYTCACGDTYTDNEKAPTGHDMEPDKSTWEEATCTDAAKATWRCKNCDYSEVKTEGDPRGHNLVGPTINGQRYCMQCNKMIKVSPEENP